MINVVYHLFQRDTQCINTFSVFPNPDFPPFPSHFCHSSTRLLFISLLLSLDLTLNFISFCLKGAII
jgi:hypothetical protein